MTSRLASRAEHAGGQGADGGSRFAIHPLGRIRLGGGLHDPRPDRRIDERLERRAVGSSPRPLQELHDRGHHLDGCDRRDRGRREPRRPAQHGAGRTHEPRVHHPVPRVRDHRISAVVREGTALPRRSVPVHDVVLPAAVRDRRRPEGRGGGTAGRGRAADSGGGSDGGSLVHRCVERSHAEAVHPR